MAAIGGLVTGSGAVVVVVLALVVVAAAWRLAPAATRSPGLPVPQPDTAVAVTKNAAPAARAERTVALLTSPGSHVRCVRPPRRGKDRGAPAQISDRSPLTDAPNGRITVLGTGRSGPTGDDDPPERDLGTPGASARARYQALRARDDERRRKLFGPFAPLYSFFVGPTRSTEAWARGAEGEEHIGAFLARCIGDDGITLHDRRIPGSRANLDHIAIVPSGVWVIDSKHYRGRLRLRTERGWFVPRRALYVGRHDRTSLIGRARRQRAVVAGGLPPAVSVRAALCFTGVELGLLARPFDLDGVLVSWPSALARTLNARGPLDADARQRLAAALARAFPPYRPQAPSGTSQRPTGAPPSA
jgi:hypothetical protein